MSNLDREARIRELRELVAQNRYCVDPAAVASRLVEEELAERIAERKTETQSATE